MTTKDTGGSAFPVAELREDGLGIREGSDGMTLRDYFAAKAMQAALAAGHDEGMRGHLGWRDELARESYRYADSMLAARKEES